MSPVVLWEEESGFGDGDPVVSLPGSGNAVPMGVEATFDYNGLILNDRTVVDKYRILSIDGLDDPDVRDSRNDNPSEHGESPGNAYYGGRTLAIRGQVEAHTLYKLRDMQMALRSAFADLEESPLTFLTGNSSKDHYINCRKLSKNQWGEEQKDHTYFREFLITLRASDPRFLRRQRKSYILSDLSENTTVYEPVTNSGNFWSRPTIRMIGPLNEFVIRNEDTGVEFSLKDSVTISSGEFYELDLDSDTPTLIDQDGVNRFSDIDSAYDTNLQIRGNTQTDFSVYVAASGVATSSSLVQVFLRDSYI